MKRKFTFLSLCLLLAVCSKLHAQFPTIYASLGSGTWQTLTTWETFTGNVTNTPGTLGTGTAATTFPSGTHFIYVRSGHTIAFGGSNRSCLGMTVESGAKVWAGETTQRRLQLATGGTGFLFPQNATLTNNGVMGGATDGLYYEPGTNAATITITGSGVDSIARIRMPGGLANRTVSLVVDKDLYLTQVANYALSVVYSGVNALDVYSLTINPGKTIKLTAADGYVNNNASATTYGTYTYNINGTLDLSASTQNMANITNFTPPAGASGAVIINVNGTLKTGAGFNASAAGGVVNMNIGNTGVVDASLATVMNFTNTWFVVSGGGILKRNVAASDVLFAVGTSTTAYNPVTINNAGTADNFSVGLQSTFTNAPSNAANTVIKQWNITEQVPGGTNAGLKLGWVTADQASGFSPAASVVIGHFTTSWEESAATVTGSGTTAAPYIATASGITSFSPFAVGNATALPIKFNGINASQNNGTINVSWKISSEINALRYEIERSADGKNFTIIGNVNAINAARYSFIDNSPASGDNYYRIKGVDKDGSLTYSSIVRINGTKKTPELTILPNPVVSGKLNVQLSNYEKGMYTIALFSNAGQKVFSNTINNEAGSSTQTLQLPANVQPGVYKLLLVNGNNKTSKTVVVQ